MTAPEGRRSVVFLPSLGGWPFVRKAFRLEAFFFAVAVAVGLTPEMLPMIVTVCLSKGALAMSYKKVIVKRINAIQNLGAMDVLCTDKTGTLTMDRVILERYCDVVLKEDQGVLALAYQNSHFQTGLKSVLDRAVLTHTETHAHAKIPEYAKVDEIPFDFARRRMTVAAAAISTGVSPFIRSPTRKAPICAAVASPRKMVSKASSTSSGERSTWSTSFWRIAFIRGVPAGSCGGDRGRPG